MDQILVLVLSLVALVAAPLIYLLADRATMALAALDGFIMVTIAGLVGVHILPHSVHAGGPWVIAIAALGFFGPGWAESALHKAADRVHSATTVLAVLGLLVHAYFDGVGMDGSVQGDSMLGIAVLLHRLPVAITLWWLLRPRSLQLALLVLFGVGVATLGGWASADQFAPALETSWLAYVQALIAGSVLHVVAHRPPPTRMPSSVGKGRYYSGIGALVGIAAVALLSSEHIADVAHTDSDFGTLLLHLSLESAPVLLLAFFLAGFIGAAMPEMATRWMKKGGPTSQAMRGVAFGLPLPICSCGVIPLYESLVRQGVPATAAMAFLVATPELGVDAILISVPLLGTEMAVLRLGAAVLLALVIGVLVGRIVQKHADESAVPHEALTRKATVMERFTQGVRYGFVEVVDHTGPWIILGIVIASFVGPLVNAQWLQDQPWGIDVVLFALIGIPTYVCASGATPVVAVLLLQGGSPGAALAFLLAGPATNVTTFGVLRSLHGTRIAVYFGVAMASLAIFLGLVVNLSIGDFAAASIPDFREHEPSWFSYTCLGALGAIYVLSILRQGPRGFMAQVHSPFQNEDEHCHDHHCH